MQWLRGPNWAFPLSKLVQLEAALDWSGRVPQGSWTIKAYYSNNSWHALGNYPTEKEAQDALTKLMGELDGE